MNEPREFDCDARPFLLLGKPAPAGTAVRLVSIPEHGGLAYDPAEWTGALVIVETGEVELECHNGDRARFGQGSVLFFEGLSLSAVRNIGREPALLTAISRPCRLKER